MLIGTLSLTQEATAQITVSGATGTCAGINGTYAQVGNAYSRIAGFSTYVIERVGTTGWRIKEDRTVGFSIQTFIWASQTTLNATPVCTPWTNLSTCTGTIVLSGGCASPSSVCSITQTSGPSTQTVSVGLPITPLVFVTTQATGVSAGVLPPGVSAFFSGNATSGTITVSGTPTSIPTMPPYNPSCSIFPTGGSCTFANGQGFTINLTPAVNVVTAFEDPTNESMTSSRFYLDFLMPVVGLTPSDFSISGTAPGTSITAVTGSGTDWFVHVNTGTGTGTINLSMNTSPTTTVNNLPFASTTLTKTAMNPGTLSAGDLVFTSYFSDGGDRFSFVNAVDIPANETIYFTDHGWNGTSWGTSLESIIEWSHSSLIPAGTQITITALTASVGTVLNKENATAGLNLSPSGDQLIAFQGQSNLIAGLHYNAYTSSPLGDDAGWDNSYSVTSTTASNLPPGLTTNTNAMRAGTEFDNGKLDCAGLPAADVAALMAYANDDANWVFDNDQLTIGSAFPACPQFLVPPCPASGIIVDATTPYCADFVDTPACWVQSGAANYIVANGYAEADFWNLQDVDYVYTTPLLAIDAGMNPMLTFDWSHLYNATYPYDSLDVEISTDMGVTWTNIFHIDGPSFTTPAAQSQAPTTGPWSNEMILLPSYAGQNVQFRYTAWSDYGPDLFLDNICVEQTPSCFTPDSLVAYDITPTNATAAFRENTVPTPATNWQFVVHTAPAANPSVGLSLGAIVTAQVVNYTNLLSPNTTYYSYVRSICGPGDTSAWSAPIVFTTSCIEAFPYLEDFETGTLDPCWAQSNIDDFDWTVDELGTSSSNTGPSTGANSSSWYLYTETSSPVVAGDTATVFSPYIDLTAALAPRLQFEYHMYGAGMDPNGTVLVEMTNDYGATWTPMFTEMGNKGNQWNTACVDLAAYAGDTVQFRISGIVSTGTGFVFENDFAIDEFSVEEAMVCLAPTALTMGSISESSALFSFIENNTIPATLWEYSYGPNGFTVGMGTQDTLTNISDSLTGLLPSTFYDLYVRAICGPCDTSAWTAVTNFNTACPASNILPTPFCQDFEGGNLAATCWTNSTADDFDWTINQNGTSSSPTGPSSGANGTNWYIYTESSFPVVGGDSAVIITPDFDLNGLTTPWLTFNYHMYGPSMSPDGTIAVEISDDAGATWNPLFSKMGEQGNLWFESCYDLIANLNDTVRFRITGVVSTTGTAFENDFAIDEFCVGEKPVLGAPTALMATNVDTFSADISWTDNSVPAVLSWEVSYGAPAFTAGMGTQVTTSSNSFTLSSLASNTTFDCYVRVKTDCDSTAWVGPIQFTTLNTCGTTAYDDGGPSTDYSSSVDETFTYCPANLGDKVSLTFTEFSFEIGSVTGCFDGIVLHNGNSVAAPIITSPSGLSDEWCWDRDILTPSGNGDLLGATVVSTAADGCLTLRVFSDGSVTREGFAATVSCAPAVPPYSVQVVPVGHIKADSLVIDGDGWFHYLNTTSNSFDAVLLSAQLGNTNTIRVDSVTSHVASGSVDLSNAPYVTSADWHVMNRTWNLATSTQPTTIVPIRTYYSVSDYNDLVAAPNSTVTAHTDLHFYKINNGKDELLSNGHASVTSADYEEFVHGTGWTYSSYGGAHRAEYSVSQFSGGGGGGNTNGVGALPVELLSFDVSKQASSNLVEWTTAWEQNNAHFYVQRSSDNFGNFKTIGRVDTKAPNGNSDIELDYRFDDEQPQVGHNYYRLEQEDINGQKSYSEIIDVIWGADGSVVTIYPNPATDILNVDVASVSEAQVQINILDMSGRVIQSKQTVSQKGLNNVRINLNNMASGIYVVQIVENNNVTHISKFRKQ